MWTADPTLRKEIIKAGEALIIKCAEKVMEEFGQNISKEDLINEGNFALQLAMDSFEYRYRNGIKFCDYVYDMVRQTMFCFCKIYLDLKIDDLLYLYHKKRDEKTLRLIMNRGESIVKILAKNYNCYWEKGINLEPIIRTALKSAVQEFDNSKNIRFAAYVSRAINREVVLSCNEGIQELIKKYKRTGSKLIANRIVEMNQGLVVKVAQDYALQHSFNVKVPMTMDDLVQEGNLGLIRAVEKYDVNRKAKFSSYAYRVIYEHMDRYFKNELSPIVHIPVNLVREYIKVRKEEGEQQKETGQVNRKKIYEWTKNIPHFDQAMPFLLGVYSLDLVEYRDGNDFEIFTREQVTKNLKDNISEWEVKELLEHILNSVNPPLEEIEKKIILLRYVYKYTLRETAEELGMKNIGQVYRREQALLELFRQPKNKELFYNLL